VNLQELGAPAALWRRWVLLAAGRAALGDHTCEIRRQDSCAHLGEGAAWLRMRRLAGNRAVLWGHHPDLKPDVSLRDELLDTAPDWSYDVDSAHAVRDVGFLGWYAHSSWSSVPSHMPDEIGAMLAPIASDAVLAEWWRTTWPDATDAHLAAVLQRPDGPTLSAVVGAAAATRAGKQVARGRDWAGRPLSATATAHLRQQIHLQMRSSVELGDRGHPARPALLRQWAHVNLTGAPFRHAVCAVGVEQGGAFVRSATNSGLADAEQRSLDNVLMELRMTETDEKSGAWLFARITSDGRSATVERAYDTWPAWYVAPAAGPTMSALHAEMEQRAPGWRPAWAGLLPSERF